MNDGFVATIEDQNNRFQQAPLPVEPESELTRRRVVVEILDPQCPAGGPDGVLGIDAVFECGVVNFHAACAAIASRIRSERDLCSRAARASRTASSSAVRRRATTCAGSAPRPGRPRLIVTPSQPPPTRQERRRRRKAPRRQLPATHPLEGDVDHAPIRQRLPRPVPGSRRNRWPEACPPRSPRCGAARDNDREENGSQPPYRYRPYGRSLSDRYPD